MPKSGDTTATVFGGSDWYAGLGHGSGLSTNPTFFKMRKGEAILESVRMAPGFFSTGFFYSEGLKVDGEGCLLWQDLNVPYHLPLPEGRRKAGGQYALQPDMAAENILGRYFSRMAFADRPSQFVSLHSRISIREVDGAFELSVDVDGPENVPVAIELAFRSGGRFSGVEALNPEVGARSARGRARSAEEWGDAYLLKEGMGAYTVGGDTIEFGPGSYFRPPGRMEGESVAWVGGRMSAVGDRVYLTGRTPFARVLRFK